MHNEETRRKALEWLNTSITIREPKYKTQICRELGISVVTLDAWDKERRNGKGKVDAVIDQLADLTDDEIAMFRRRVHERAMADGASAKHMELNAKLLGMLIEKSEMRVKLSADADELAKLDAEAERRARTFREQNRAPNLQEGTPLLPQKIREDT